VIDGHVALWDASPANQRNRHGEEFINCFYNYHKISPKEYYRPREKFEKYDEADFMKDLFEDGYVDMAIFQPAYLALSEDKLEQMPTMVHFAIGINNINITCR
jgi:uncharacterized protein